MTYLDHAATTPMSPAALETARELLGRTGNASSLHCAGRAARRVVEESRERIAAALGARPSEVVFTAGGTEADNLAVKGLFWSRRACDPRHRRIVLSAVEHHAVLDPAQWLEQAAGAQVDLLPVDAAGRVLLPELHERLRGEDLALVSVMWANNEVGTVQPVREIAAAARDRGVPVHADAVQAVGQLPVDFAASGLDALTVSGHKVGGPVGVGALVARRGAALTPVLHGGGQERGVRSGSLDVASIAAFSVAVEEACAGQEESARRLGDLRDELVAGVLAVVPEAVLRGPDVLTAGADRLPGNALFTFPGCEGDSLLYLLDSAGIQCSTGSACQAGVPQPSHVLLAMGLSSNDARGALRFSLGRTSTREDVGHLLRTLRSVVDRAQAAGLASMGVPPAPSAAAPSAVSLPVPAPSAASGEGAL